MCHRPTQQEASESRAREAVLDRIGGEPDRVHAAPADPRRNTRPRGNPERDEDQVRIGLEKLATVIGN